MAWRSYHFPSSTGHFDTPIGEIRIRIQHEYTSTVNTNVTAKVTDIGKIDLPFEITPSSNTFRFSAVKIEMTYNSFFDGSYFNYAPNGTFVDIYLDGNIYFRGIINFDKVKRKKYYIDSGGSLAWQTIEFEIVDCLAYFFKNTITLADAGYSQGDTVQQTLSAMLTDMGVNPLNLDLDSNFLITEDYGSAEYDLTDLHVNWADTELASDFIKYLIVELGMYVYFLDSYVHVIMRNGGTTLNIDTDDIIDIDQLINENVIEYTYLLSQLYLGDEFDHPVSGLPVTPEYANAENFSGTESDDDNRNFKIESTVLLDQLYTIATGDAQYPLTPDPDDDRIVGGTDTSLITNDTYVDFQAGLVETGDIIWYNGLDLSALEAGSLINAVPDTDTIYFEDTDITPDVNDKLQVWRGTDTTRKRYKLYKIAELVESIYADYFLTSPDVFKVVLKDVSSYDDFKRRFVLLSNNHKIRKAQIDLLKDEISLELVQVT